MVDLPSKAFFGQDAPNNVLDGLLLSEEVAELFLPYWVKSKTKLSLTPTEQGFIILRSALVFNCDYVWGIS